MKIKRLLSTTINILLFAVLCLMIMIVVISKASGGEPSLFGNEFKIVLSGSMEPTFKTGSVIAVKPEINTADLKANDVITFLRDERTLVTHRIVEVIETGAGNLFKTQGDSNAYADAELVLDQNVVAQYTGFTIPYLGYMMNFANSQLGIVLLLILPGVLLLGYAILSIYQGFKILDKEAKKISESH
ncbi:signal peptidase I SipW [Bacillus horti]|uniref:Signal peptidase I n=1 Tax=Caldalkalibacillus horti TaxID=77523 RepID=A0ABT9W4J6_9BACI|nr:signal peptidase I [Bacillus horti]MDQ0167989.1 signal peptidase [Bacillus horti]